MTVVGGVFGFPFAVKEAASQSAIWDILPSAFFVNARSALAHLVAKLKPRCVWLPSFLCPEIVRALEHLHASIDFVPVDGALRPDRACLRDFKSGDLLVLITYFGFPIDWAFVDEARAKGVTVLIDASQALFMGFDLDIKTRVDFILFSPRKLLPVPDGGILVAASARFHDLIPASIQSAPPADWWADALEVRVERFAADGDPIRGLDGTGWFANYQRTEHAQPIGDYRMSKLSRTLIATSFSYPSLATARREDYQVLYRELSQYALFQDLPDGTVPLGLPLAVEKRSKILATLFRSEIFPPIHWQIDKVVPKRFSQSHALSQRIMTIPCDHRYDAETMRAVAHAVASAINE